MSKTSKPENERPFEPLVPNEETIEAMKAARRGELTTVGPPGKLLPSLNPKR
jgi:DNA-damage-inducible protein J